MKAAFYERNETIRIGEITPALPAAGEVQLQVAYCGICGTDLGIYHGKMDWRVAQSQIMGHEVSGLVKAVGEEVKGFSVGEAVTVMPLDPCGDCPACRAGHSHICHRLRFLGIDTPGAFQQLWNVPAHTLIKLPPSISLRHAALIEPLAVACHDIRLGEVSAGEFVVVVGGGSIGALIGLAAREQGARVLTAEINPHRLQKLAELELETVDPSRTDLPALVEERTNGAGADVVFEVTGHPAGIESAVKLPRTRGRIVVVGIFGKPAPVDLFRFFWRELRLLGARVYEREDFEKAVALASAGSLPLDRLITDMLPLDRLHEGIRRMDSGGDVMKILIQCSEQHSQ